MAFLFVGQQSTDPKVETEIVGTNRTLRIGSVGTDSMLQLLGTNGICRE